MITYWAVFAITVVALLVFSYLMLRLAVRAVAEVIRRRMW